MKFQHRFRVRALLANVAEFHGRTASLAALTAPATATDIQIQQASIAVVEQSLKQAGAPAEHIEAMTRRLIPQAHEGEDAQASAAAPEFGEPPLPGLPPAPH